jgi:hypothetical protein
LANLRVAASNFSIAGLNRVHSLSVGRRRCLKHAVTVGIPSIAGLYGTGPAVVALASYRAMAVKCAIDFGTPSLSVLANYNQFEATEKANISYWIGMTLASIVADDVLGASLLTHAARIRTIARANPTSKSLVDLVGIDRNRDWHVIEAKARQTRPSDTADARVKWKDQAVTIRHISGSAPITHSYCLSLLRSSVTVELVDPPPSEGDEVTTDLDLSPTDLVRNYYAPFDEYLDASNAVNREVGGRNLRLSFIGVDPVDRVYTYIGVDNLVRAYWQSLSVTATRGIPEVLDSDQIFVGRDGIAVMTSTEQLA